MKSTTASAAVPATSPARPRRRWIKWVVIAVAVIAVGYVVRTRSKTREAAASAGGGSGRPGSRAGGGPQVMPVTAEPARKADLQVRLVSLGTVTPLRTVTVHSRVDGQLEKLHFTEGQTVEAGAPLADLDAKPFEAQKKQAEAQLAKDAALLDDARINLTRYQTLLEQDSVAKQQVDTQAALVRQYEAALKLDDAAVDTASLQLAYAHITSPLTGRIGLRAVDEGNIVHASDAAGVAVITQLKPITVLFSIPQDSIRAVRQSLASGHPLVVEAFDRDGRTKLADGKLATMDNQIDPATGTVRLRAEFANADETLFPNQFVNVQLVVQQLHDVTVVPTAAVQRGTVGTYVFVVSDQKTVALRKVETGPTEAALVSIRTGVAPGEVVVIDGVDKLREGATVEIVSHDASAAGANAGSAAAGAKHGKSGKRPENANGNGSGRPATPTN